MVKVKCGFVYSRRNAEDRMIGIILTKQGRKHILLIKTQKESRRRILQNTKKKLADALKKLMVKKNFRKITIEELVIEAGMTRQSFYYHFEDIYDLLAYLCRQEVQLWFEDCDESDFSSWLSSLFERMESSRELFGKIFNEIRAGQIHDYILDEVENQVKTVIQKPGKILDFKLDAEANESFAVELLSESIFWFYFMKVTRKISIGWVEFAKQYHHFLTNIIVE